jgi:DNA-binding FrmR family transcriptional regulator
MRHAIIAFLSLASLAGCASSPPEQPDWISGNSAKYADRQYLLGRGQAGTQADAQDRARADLAKIFAVQIEVSSEDVQQFNAGKYDNQVTRSISTRTDQIVSGIQIAEQWQNPTTREFHALAVLPRLQAANSLRQQIAQLDEGVNSYIREARDSTDLLQQIAAASQAYTTQLARDALQKPLQVVDITGRGVESPQSSSKLRADLTALLKRVRIAPQVPANAMPGLLDGVTGALSQAGFMVETGQNADFILNTNLNLIDLGLQSGWYWQRGTLNISLSDASTGRVRGTKRWDVKASAVNSAEASKRALDQADGILQRELGAAIIELAAGK